MNKDQDELLEIGTKKGVNKRPIVLFEQNLHKVNKHDQRKGNIEGCYK